MELTFFPASLSGTVTAPPSKSEAHRRMICAGLTRGTVELSGYRASGDTEATARCLSALGARLSLQEDTLQITGYAQKPALVPVYDCGESGSTLRFFVPLALALTHGGIFRMHGRLSQRPMDVYRELFVPRGVLWRMSVGADGAAELRVTGGMEAGDFVLPGDVSSQFVSGLMFAMPMLEGNSTLTVRPPVESIGYIRLTVQALRDSGIEVEQTGEYSWRIPGRQSYQAASCALRGDWSQAAVLLCMGALAGEVTVTGLEPDSLQGDRAIVDCLERMGAAITARPDGVTIRQSALHGVELDLRDTPDIGPILALACQLAEGKSLLHGCGRLRLKESDRLNETISMLNALGGHVELQGDTLAIEGAAQLRGGVSLPPIQDHRMVMLASAAAVAADAPITVSGAESLAKSWPDYLSVYRALGGKVE